MTRLLAVAAVVLTAAACQKQPEPPPPPPPAPQIVKFSASPSSVKAGEKATLTWETKDATSVALTEAGKGVVSGADGLSGTLEVTVQEDALYILTAKNDRGVTETAAAMVDVQDTPTQARFVATPNRVESGGEVTLAWGAPGAQKVSLTEKGGAAIDLVGQTESGTVSVHPAVTTTWVLTVDGIDYEATVAVNPVISGFELSEAAVLPGDMVTATWKTSGASDVSLTVAGVGEIAHETDPSKVADGTATFTVPADIDPAAALTFHLVASDPASNITVTQDKVLYVAGTPKLQTVTVPPYAAKGGDYTVSWVSTGADSVQVLVDGAVVYVTPVISLVDQGSVTLPTQSQDVVVRVKAINSRGGQDLSDPFTVNPVGPITLNSFTATPVTLQNGGDPVTLAWDIPNARNVKISVKNGRQVATATGTNTPMGSVAVYPNKDTDYVLQADNGIGDKVAAEVSVKVTNPATLIFNPPTAPSGATVTLTGSTAPNSGDITLDGYPVLNGGTAQFVDIAVPANDTSYTGYDTTSMVYTLPQAFVGTLNGQPVNATKIAESVNGWFYFSGTSFTGPDGPTSGGIATDLPALAVAPYFDDLYVGSSSAGKIYAQLDTVNGVQRLIVQWENVSRDGASTSSLSFQAQVYADDHVVFAYKTMTNIPASSKPAIGVTGKLGEVSDLYTQVPAAGDVLTFGITVTPPAQIKVFPNAFNAHVAIGTTGQVLDIDNVKYPVMTPNGFVISEVNYNPASGKSEWFEVQNNTSTAVDLGGWTIDFGGGSTHTITGPLMLPANGRLVFGQDPDAAEASSGGAPVDYVYGSTFSMNDAGGSLSLSLYGGVYATFVWNGPGTQGVTTQNQPAGNGLVIASGAPALTCNSTQSYGSSGQKGTPGGPNGYCFPYTVAAGPASAFQSIATTGTNVGTLFTTTTSNSGTDIVVVALTLPRPVKLFGQSVTNLYVSSNGWVSPVSTTSASDSNKTAPSSTTPTGTIAPFWDDLQGNISTASAPSAVKWQQFDPDGTPNSGDEYTLLSWEHWKIYADTSDLNFQIKFFEASGDLEYRYGSMTSNTATYAQGSSATTWLESSTGDAALVWNVNSTTSPGIAPNTSIHFTAH